MDEIKLFAKNEKELETLIHAVSIYSEDIGMNIGIEKMVHTNNEKRKTTNDRRKRTTKSRKNQNTQRKRNLQILGYIRS